MRRCALVLLGVASIVAACATRPDKDALVPVLFPDEKQFVERGVSDFMSNRCGALDCHGNPARALRIYGQNGLRLKIPPADSGLPRDTGLTTAEERHANYNSVVGLEPEDMSEAVASGGSYLDFQLFKKPLDIGGGGVRHKGGPVLRNSANDPGWMCMWTWVQGNADAKACTDAVIKF